MIEEERLIKLEQRLYNDIEKTVEKSNKNFCVAVDRFTIMWIITLVVWWMK